MTVIEADACSAQRHVRNVPEAGGLREDVAESLRRFPSRPFACLSFTANVM
jgi:hypothetical protein